MSSIAFGQWLEQRRKTLDLTRNEVAKQANVSVAMLRKLESGERRPSPEMAATLAKALLIPQELRDQFIQFSRTEQRTFPTQVADVLPVTTFDLPTTTHKTPTNLRPTLTKLIGRETELARLHERIIRDEARLLTLVGLGGVGKTSLALSFAQSTLNRFPDGVYFVNLALLGESTLVAKAILSAIGGSETQHQSPLQSLKFALRDKKVLLVLDNFEHVLDAAPLVSELLTECAYISTLVTSREPLRVRGERQIALAPLLTDSAIKLFVDRARDIDAGFEYGPANATAIQNICKLLDGLPIAIEFSAGWVHTLSCNEIEAEIRHNFDFLAANNRDVDERHRSVRAAFDYSWKRLSADEQLVLSKLPIFRGLFNREAAEIVAGSTTAILSSLVAKSMVRRAQNGYYDLHELVRQYAYAKLDPAVHQSHANYYLLQAERLDQFEWDNAVQSAVQFAAQCQFLEMSQENIRAALKWLRENDAPSYAHMVIALDPFWTAHGLRYEEHEYASVALQNAGAVLPHNILQRLKLIVCEMSYNRGDLPTARKLLAELEPEIAKLGNPSVARLTNIKAWIESPNNSLPLLEEVLHLQRMIGSDLAIGRSMISLSTMMLFLAPESEYARAASLLREGMALVQPYGDHADIEAAKMYLGTIEMMLGNLTSAHAIYLEIVGSHHLHNSPMLAWLWSALGEVNWAMGDLPQAQVYFQRAMKHFSDSNDSRGQCILFHHLAQTQLDLGHIKHAAKFFLECLKRCDVRGHDQMATRCFAGLSAVALQLGNPALAAQLIGYVQSQLAQRSHHIIPHAIAQYHQLAERIRNSMAEQEFTTLADVGSAFSADALVKQVMTAFG